MRRRLSRAVFSLGVMVLCAGGMAATATVASASPTNCNIPIVYNSGNQAGSVSAASQPSCDGTVTAGTVANPDPTPPPAATAPVVPTSSTSLAFTGADVWQTVVLAVILIGGGLLVVRLSRRRQLS